MPTWEAWIQQDENGCWLWPAPIDDDGYGRMHYLGPLAHRYSYEIHIGPIPPGLEIDHLCRNRRCVNPAHLEPVTRRENNRRSWQSRGQSRKAACPAGHKYGPENTYTDRAGGRHCRACDRDRKRRRRGTNLPLPD